MSAVWLSLVAAATYGLSDFVGGSVSRRTSAWAVALTAQVGALVVVLVLAATAGGRPDTTDLAWGLLAGIGNGTGAAFLYRGLGSGRMGVVAPVSGVGAVALPVVVGLLLGERPGPLVWTGLLAAVPAIWLVTREPAASGDAGVEAAVAPTAAGLRDGALAGLGFGTLFVALSRVTPEAGFWPLALNQAVAVLVVLAVATALRASWVPPRACVPLGLTAGVLAAASTAVFLLATRTGYLAVTAVITSLYPAFTVVLAALALREPVHRVQGVGLGLCAAAVVLVALG